MRLEILISVCLLFETSNVWAQQPSRPRPDTSLTSIMARARRGNLPSGIVLDILRQRGAAYTAQSRNALADSITALAVSHAGEAFRAVQGITRSGARARSLGGQPDPGALDRLIDIHRNAANSHTRRDALLGMLSQTNPGRALAYLRDVSLSDAAEDAVVAILQLDEFASRSPDAPRVDRARAESILHELNDENLIKLPVAVASICDVARSHRWQLKSTCPRA